MSRNRQDSSLLHKKKEESRQILDESIYKSKEGAIKACSMVTVVDQITQACVLCEWIFARPRGIMLLIDSIVKGCADMGYIHVFEGRTTPMDDIVPVLPLVRGRNPIKIDRFGPVKLSTSLNFHPWFSMLCHVFVRCVCTPISIDIRTSWNWISSNMYLCPWGSSQNYVIVPVKYIDIRCKEALSAMIYNSAWTSCHYMPKSKTCAASTFRYNEIGQSYFDEKGALMFMIGFPLYLAFSTVKEYAATEHHKVIKDFISDFFDHVYFLSSTHYNTKGCSKLSKDTILYAKDLALYMFSSQEFSQHQIKQRHFLYNTLKRKLKEISCIIRQHDTVT